MTAKEMIESIQIHHPHMGETEIIKLLNRTKDAFCEQTEIFKKTDTSITTAANTRWYDIPAGLTKIEEVYLNNIKIPRLQGNPLITDDDE
jgi:hypothetical protein